MSTKSPSSSIYFHVIEYGSPACSYIECEIGIVPESCLSSQDRDRLRHYRMKALIQQSQCDRDQHYDMDGVSVNGTVIVAGEL